MSIKLWRRHTELRCKNNNLLRLNIIIKQNQKTKKKKKKTFVKTYDDKCTAATRVFLKLLKICVLHKRGIKRTIISLYYSLLFIFYNYYLKATGFSFFNLSVAGWREIFENRQRGCTIKNKFGNRCSKVSVDFHGVSNGVHATTIRLQ